MGKLHKKHQKPGNFCLFISPAFFDPFSAALKLLQTAVIGPVWVTIQHVAFLTPLLATVLQLIEQFNQCLLSK